MPELKRASHSASGGWSLQQGLDERLLLHVLTDHEWSHGRDMLTVATAALAGGATVVQLRDKRASTRTLIEEGLALRALTRAQGALLIVNDRVDVALAVEADGAHVGQEDLPASMARRLLGPARLLGVSVATVQEAEEAVAAGADYLGVGPIFATATKSDAGSATGTRLLTDVARTFALPLIAIGGITIENAAQVVQAGATGLAVITAVVHAADIAGAARQLRRAAEAASQERARGEGKDR